MGKPAVGYEERAEFISVFVLVPPRKNGLPNMAAVQAAMLMLENFNPEAYDPPEPVTEAMARAATRDGVVWRETGEHFEMTADNPPVPTPGPFDPKWIVVEDDEIPGPRCSANGACYGD